MNCAIEQLYYIMSKSIKESPDYREALSQWSSLHPNLALEDAAFSREYQWGALCFSAGLDLGLSLSQELTATWKTPES
jgi:hypothetical protein